MVLRYARKFTNYAGTDSITFPLTERRTISTQLLRSAAFTIPGTNYPVRALAYGAGLKAEARETISFVLYDPGRRPLVVDAKWDSMKSKLFSFGVGKLWTYDQQENMRWAWAYIEQMPSAPMHSGINRYHLDVTVTFIRLSDWYDADAITPASYALAGLTTFTVNNPGNAPIYNAIITIAGTFDTPTIHNITSGHYLISSRTGTSANDILRFDAGKPSIERSTDAGVSWAGDYENYLRVSGQVQLMVLEPGNNSFSVGGVTSGTMGLTAYPAYH